MIKNFFKSDVIKMISALAVVGVFSAITLVFVYEYSMPKIEENIRRATDEGIKSIFPEADTVEEMKHKGVFEVRGQDKNLMGYAFIAEGNGYQGPIQVIAGVDPGLRTMTGLQILESQETPGLGAEIAGDFRKQFSGLSVVDEIECIKNREPDKPGEIEAITGATISSQAVVNMLNNRLAELRDKLGVK